MTEHIRPEPDTQHLEPGTRQPEARNRPYRFDPVDVEQVRQLSRLPPGRRIQVLLDARELAVGMIRGRLRRQHPDLSRRELNLKVLEEIDRVGRTRPGP